MKRADYLNPDRIEYLDPYEPRFTRNKLKVRVAASFKNLTAEVKSLVDEAKPSSIVFKTGCGNSISTLALDEADCYASSIKIDYWTVCAGDVLIKAMGGYATDIDGRRFDFHNGE
jgi:3'-phosphoadenosine 5'-phosphosulfate (PAPS) 3'-phosphatase